MLLGASGSSGRVAALVPARAERERADGARVDDETRRTWCLTHTAASGDARACSSPSRSRSISPSRPSPGRSCCSSAPRSSTGARARRGRSGSRRWPCSSSSRSRPSRTASSGSPRRGRRARTGKASSTTPRSCSPGRWTPMPRGRAARPSSTRLRIACCAGSSSGAAVERATSCSPAARRRASRPRRSGCATRSCAGACPQPRSSWSREPQHAGERDRLGADRRRARVPLARARHERRARAARARLLPRGGALARPAAGGPARGGGWGAGCRARQRSRRARRRCASSQGEVAYRVAGYTR